MGWKLPQLRPVLNEETSLFGTTPFSLPEARYFKYFIEKETLLVAVSVGKTRIPRNSHAFIRREIRVEGVGEKTGMDPRDLIRIAESLAEGSRCGTSRGSSGPRRPAPGANRSLGA